MATYTSLASLFTAIADAIRAKTGSTATIVADNFPAEIAAIETGGSVETCEVTVSSLSQEVIIGYVTTDENNNITPAVISTTEIPSLQSTVLTVVKGQNMYMSDAEYQGTDKDKASYISYSGGLTLAGQYDRFYYFTVSGDGSYARNLCFVRDTKILLADGTTKPVQDITYSDNLLVWDFDNGCYASAKPLWIKNAQIASYYYRCEFENGMVLKLVGSGGKCHRVFDIERGLFESATDCVGKRVMTEQGETVLLSCERVDEDVEFYNIITHTHINLYAEGVLTSCRLNNIYPIQNMKFVKDDRAKRTKDTYCTEIALDMFHGLRLAEQTADVDEINDYVARLYALADYN